MAYTMSVRQLFESLLPRLLQETSFDVDGPVLFQIAGKDGGTWWVDFRARTIAEDVASSAANTIVRAHEGDFMALLEGRMSVDDGLLTGRLHLAGDAASIPYLVDALARIRGSL